MSTTVKIILAIVAVAIVAAGAFSLGRSSTPTPTNTPTPTPMAAPTAASQPASQPAGSTNAPATSVAPNTTEYGLPPQPYIPHPSLYLETGHTGTDEQKTQTWTLGVLDGSTLVYGGYRVNNIDGGVYGAISGPTTVTITVTDGFVSIVTNNWAQQEYCFRLSQAIQYRWPHDHLHPLQGWSCQ